jgi:hypothetical protein
MKLLLIFLLLTGTAGPDQGGRYPVKKLYAFRQSVSGGTNALLKEQKGPAQRLLIYVKPWPGKEIRAVSLWIEGTARSFTTKVIPTPVVQKESVSLGRKKGNRTLVPGNGNEVLEIIEGAAVSGTPYPSHLKVYPVLLQYEYAGKSYYLGGNWKQLPSIVRQ